MVRGLLALSISGMLAGAFAGCSKGEKVGGEASPMATISASSEASSSSQTSAEASPQEPTSSPSPGGMTNGPADVLSPEQGTILRLWPNALTWSKSSDELFDFWQSQDGATGPFDFVFELPAQATVNQLIFNAARSPDTDSKTAHVFASTTSATAGYTEVGAFAVGASSDEQTVPLPKPIRARWLKVTIDQRGSSTTFDGLRAIGVIDQRPPAGPLSGAWVYSEDLQLTYAAVDSATQSFPRPIDPAQLTSDHEFLEIHQTGPDVLAVTCSPSAISGVFIGKESGSTVTWSNRGPDFPAAIINSEGDMLVGARPGQNPYVAARTSGGGCAGFLQPNGQGKQVLVLFDQDPRVYPPVENNGLYPGYHFVPLPLVMLDAKALAGFDTVVISHVCNANAELTKTQARLLTDWVSMGYKLMIYDSDRCTSSDYSFLPYSFRTSNPGRQGASSNHLVLVESNELGSDKSDAAHFIDSDGYAATQNNQLGDANVVTTKDSHWCGHFFGTNVLNQNGYLQMYAPYGQGLIIYDGFDRDDAAIPQYQRILQLELALPAAAKLPCSQSVATDFSVAPSAEHAFTPGKAEALTFHLKVLASHGFSGVVNLSSERPPEAAWATSLSVQQVSVNANAASFDFTVQVPQNARAGRHVFTVAGTSDTRSATASIVLTSFKPQMMQLRVEPTPKPQHIAKTLAAKKRISVYGIYFDFASDTIRAESAPVLKEIAAALVANPSWKLTIEGHTDSVGTAEYNLDLSKRRAEAVKRALVNQYHIRAARLSTVGFGLTRPKASNDTVEGRALNRRVELVRS